MSQIQTVESTDPRLPNIKMSFALSIFWALNPHECLQSIVGVLAKEELTVAQPWGALHHLVKLDVGDCLRRWMIAPNRKFSKILTFSKILESW